MTGTRICAAQQQQTCPRNKVMLRQQSEKTKGLVCPRHSRLSCQRRKRGFGSGGNITRE